MFDAIKLKCMSCIGSALKTSNNIIITCKNINYFSFSFVVSFYAEQQIYLHIFLLSFIRLFISFTIEVKRMGVNIQFKNFFNGFFNRFNAWITKFNYLACISQNHMIMLSIKIRFFILCLIFSELMFSNQTTFQK